MGNDRDDKFEKLDEVIDVDQGDVSAHLSRCIAYQEKGDYDRAITDCDALLMRCVLGGYSTGSIG